MDDAIDKLLDLSPFDLKHLLLLIFSSKEFTVDESEFSLSLPSLLSFPPSPFPPTMVLMSVILPSLHTVKCRESLIIEGQIMNLPTKQLSIVASSKKRAHGKLQKNVKVSGHGRIC